MLLCTSEFIAIFIAYSSFFTSSLDMFQNEEKEPNIDPPTAEWTPFKCGQNYPPVTGIGNNVAT